MLKMFSKRWRNKDGVETKATSEELQEMRAAREAFKAGQERLEKLASKGVEAMEMELTEAKAEVARLLIVIEVQDETNSALHHRVMELANQLREREGADAIIADLKERLNRI